MTSDLKIERLFSVAHQVVLVTGGARGIGWMFSQALATNGATVLLCSRKADRCRAAAERLNRECGRSDACIALSAVDLGSVSECRRLADEVAQLDVVKARGLNALVNNSGVSWGESFPEHSEKGWNKVFNVNVRGLFFLSQALAPLLARTATRSAPARIINVGSVAGVNPQPFPTFAYDASKTAVHHLTRSMASALNDQHILVNCIAPGYFPSQMTDGLSNYVSEAQLKETIPRGRRGEPGDMAGVLLWLLSAAGSFVQGVVVVVDGGQTYLQQKPLPKL